MKRVFTFVAALLVVAMMASCTSQADKNADALVNAMQTSDNAKVTELVNVMKSSKDLDAEGAILVISAYVWQISTQPEDVKAQAYADCAAFYETAKAVKDFDKTVQATKGSNGEDIISTMRATMATYEANLQAAQEAEEYDEDEDSYEEDEE